MKNEQQTTETKIWAIDQIMKFTLEIENIKEMMNRKTFNEHDQNFNRSMWALKIDMIESQIEQLKIWIVNN